MARPVSSHGLDEVEIVEVHPGIVLATYPMLKPCMDWSGPITNADGGRPTERLGLSDAIVRGPPVMSGTYAFSIPIPRGINTGLVLKDYPELEVKVKFWGVNDVGGRPDKCTLKYGSYTRTRIWEGGEPCYARKKQQYSCGEALCEFPDLHDIIKDEGFDRAPYPEGTVLASYPTLRKQDREEVQVREKLPYHLKRGVTQRTQSINFLPGRVVWNPKPANDHLPNYFQFKGTYKAKGAAAPSA